MARLPGPVRAEVILTHGLGEHSERYRHVAAAFAERGLRVWAYDLHGHGRAPGRRGDAPNYGVFLKDLARVVQEAAVEGRPRFLMGHSFGAQIMLNYLLAQEGSEPVCRGAVAASPWLRLAFRPVGWRRVLARVMLALWPGFRQRTPHDRTRLSRDPEHVGTLAGPELMHHRLSARLYFLLMQAGEAALAGAARFRTPVLLLHGGDDRVTSMKATQEFFERAGSADKTFEIYPEARHETHNDLGRGQVLADIAAWIEARLD